MKLAYINNICSLFTETDVGTCVSFILPSYLQDKQSHAYCTVNEINGKLSVGPFSSFIRFSTLMEMNWYNYRKGSHENYNRIRNLNYSSSGKTSLLNTLSNWLARVDSTCTLCKLFYGGDITSKEMLLCSFKLAELFPEYIFYIQTAKQTIIKNISINKLPNNFIIGIEQQCNSIYPCRYAPRINYVYNDTCKHEIEYFPTDKESNYYIKITDYCHDAFRTKIPIVEEFLFPENSLEVKHM